MSNKDSSIFLDSTGKRWKKVLFAGVFIFLSIFFLLCILVLSIYSLPSRPSFLTPLSSERHIFPPRLPLFFPNSHELLRVSKIKSLLKTREEYKKKYTDRNNNSQETVAAFLGDEDAGGYSALKSNLSRIDILFPRWVTLDPNGVIYYGNNDYINQVLNYVVISQSHIAVMPVVSNLGKSGWSTTGIKKIMSDDNLRDAFLSQILSWAQKNKFAG